VVLIGTSLKGHFSLKFVQGAALRCPNFCINLIRANVADRSSSTKFRSVAGRSREPVSRSPETVRRSLGFAGPAAKDSDSVCRREVASSKIKGERFQDALQSLAAAGPRGKPDSTLPITLYPFGQPE